MRAVKNTYAGMGLIAMATLVLELALTRVFSVVLYYHFAFMVISLALFGIGASGVFIYVRSKHFVRDKLREQLPTYCGLFALTTVLGLAYLLQFKFQLEQDPSWEMTLTLLNLGHLFSLYLVSTLPFFFSGVAISLVIFHHEARIGYVYFSDLLGAALGCLGMPILMTLFGGPGTILAAAFLGVVAALLFELRDSDDAAWQRPWRSAVATLALVALVGTGSARGWFEVGSVKSVDESQVVFSRWNAYSWIAVQRHPDGNHSLTIDALASTVLYSRDTVATRNEAQSISALVHQFRGEDSRVLIIGPGGGVDIVSALYHGSEDVLAVEINPIIIHDVMLGEFRDSTTSLYDSPGVRVVEGEGRSFVRRSTDRFDVIQVTLIDTWAATAAGAFALSENTLYTVDAYEDFYEHLDDDGVLSMSRWRLDEDREFIRLVGLAREALARRGVPMEETPRHIFAAQHYRLATLLMRRTPFTAEELTELDEISRRQGYQILHSPARDDYDNDVGRLARAPDPGPVYAAYPFEIEPVDDDRPFFFYSPSRAGMSAVFEDRTNMVNDFAQFIMVSLLLVVLVLVTLAMVFPLFVFRRDAMKSNVGRKMTLLVYFISLGLGFITVEIGLLQRFSVFLGHPSFSLVVVLFSILLSSAIGAALSERIAEAQLGTRFLQLAGSLVAIVIVYGFGLGALVDGLISLELWARIAVTAVLVALPGALMGMMVPLGVRFCREQGVSEIVPWAWGMNGACSVLGSVVSMMVAMNWGLAATLFVGAACYLGGIATLEIVRRRAGAPASA